MRLLLLQIKEAVKAWLSLPYPKRAAGAASFISALGYSVDPVAFMNDPRMQILCFGIFLIGAGADFALTRLLEDST